MFNKFCLIFLFIPFVVFSQIEDDFSDGNFIQNPEWIGDINNFIVNDNYQLQLNDTDEGDSYLSTKNQNISNTQWEFWIRINFSPSDNNHPRIYLVSDNDNLRGEVNGYYIQIGKSGADNKRIYFYRQDGEESYELMEGDYNLAEGSNNLVQIKVTRDAEGNWEFWANKSGEELFIPQGSYTDNTYNTTEWFGVHCFYTTSNADAFYFDDIYVGDIIPDTKELIVNYTVPVNSMTLDVYFNKVVDKSSAEINSKYEVEGIGNPVIAERLDNKPYVVRLLFGDEFDAKVAYNINISVIQDYSREFLLNYYSDTFHLYHPASFDVVINELMANPTPVVGLSPYRYIELHNTADCHINIEGWAFQSGSDDPTFLPAGIIPSKGFLVLVREGDLPYFSEYDNVVVADLGYYYLTTSGRTIALYDNNGDVMHAVSYTEEWYDDSEKEDGGWSLEQIDPYNPCGGSDNWRASVDPKGGTPGEINSVDDNNPDTTSPRLVRAGFQDPSNITLLFSEPMKEAALLSTESYEVNNEIGNPSKITPVEPDFRKVELLLTEELQEGKIYNVGVTDDLTDCVGNTLDMEHNVTQVGIPEPADSNDVVINEVLFNPPEEASQRYIELYNRSEKVIDLKNYIVTSKDTVENQLTTINNISPESYLFFPGEYVVLTTNPTGVKDHYMTTNPDGFIRMSGMPRMTNAGGVAVFAHKSHSIIDKVIYKEDMHYALLYDKSGVALERRNYGRPSDSESNWHSAAENVNFGTPGYKNSQFTYDPDAIEDDITIEPEIFSPNNDGYDDVLNIYFKFDEPGHTANVTIYDSRGRRIKKVKRSKLLGTDDVVIWDGSTDSGQKANIGMYVIFIELFGPDGNVRTYKKSAILAGRLD